MQSNASAAPADAVLLSADGRPITHGELLERSQAIADVLRRLSIDKTDRVAIVMPNGVDMAIAFLGIASSAVSAPLNPNLPVDEYRFYLSDLKAKAIVVGEGTADAVRTLGVELGIEIIEMSSLREAVVDETESRRDPGSLPSGSDIALVLHTSGTTSRPKLVPLTQANLCTSAANVRASLALTPGDRCLNVMPLFHIHGLVGVLLSSIHAGASVICCPGYDDETFRGCVEKWAPTWYSAVPTIHQSVLKLANADATLAEASRFRLIRSSSASLAPPLMHALESVFEVPVIEAYGMTEAAHQMACNPLPPGERKAGSVGLPAGPQIAIMDEDGELLPADRIGEIVIRGENVMAGYLNNPDANATAFTNSWFRTGDQGSLDNDGYLRITGRLKEIVNRGGEKISPREVDEVLMTHPGVAQVVAFAIPHESLGEDLVAAVVIREGADLTEEALREHAFSHLATFKVPSQIVFVDTVPKGPTGKLQRIGLHEKLARALRTEFVAPRSDVEEIVCELWREVLQLERVGVRDNFFRLGGDSLAGVKLVARLDARFELEVEIEEVFRTPTVAGQGSLVERLLIDQIVDAESEP